jgi:hypothetical protein
MPRQRTLTSLPFAHQLYEAIVIALVSRAQIDLVDDDGGIAPVIPLHPAEIIERQSIVLRLISR